MIVLKRRCLVGLAVAAIYAVIAVSVMCPVGWAAEPPDVILPKLNDLKQVISSAVDVYPTLFTDTNTMQQANALYLKIDAVKMMVEEGNYLGAAAKLENDIAPKVNICGTVRVRALSWLTDNPDLQDVAYEFAGMCQERIDDILDGLTNYNG